MEAEFTCMPFESCRSDVLVHEIMKALRLSRPDAIEMAFGMLVKELLIAAMAMTAPEETQVPA